MLFRSLITIVNDIPGTTNYYVNQIDTAGSGNWGGPSYQQAITNIGTSPTLSGTISSSGVITGISSTSNLVAGMSLYKVSGTGNFGSSPVILSVDSSTQITVSQSSGSYTAGSITFYATGSEPNNLPALTGKQYYLPLASVPTYNEGDYLIIDTTVISPKHPEIVRIPTGGLVRTGAYPYYIIVERQPFGTFAPTRSDHPDNQTYQTKVRKVNVAFDATWTTNNLTASTGSSLVQLSEFGGTLTTGDYIMSQRRPPFTAVASTGSNVLQNVVSNSYTLALGQTIYSETVGVDIPSGTTITNIGTGGTITLSNNVTGSGVATFTIDVGEIIKIASTSTSTTRKLTINNGATPALTTFEVNSVTGDTTFGNASIANSGNLTIYGNMNFVGGCGNGSTTTDRKLTFRNELYETVSINTCNGDATFGSPNATVFAIGGYFNSTKAAHTTTESVVVYRTDPFATQYNTGNGPLTSIQSAVTSATWDIPVQSISGFSKGDLVLICDGSLTSSPTKVEIIKITGTPYTSGSVGYLPTIYNSEYPAGTYPTGGRGQETTTPTSWSSGAVVVKIQKDSRTTTLGEAIPATGRSIVELPNTNTSKIRVKLVNGD